MTYLEPREADAVSSACAPIVREAFGLPPLGPNQAASANPAGVSIASVPARGSGVAAWEATADFHTEHVAAASAVALFDTDDDDEPILVPRSNVGRSNRFVRERATRVRSRRSSRAAGAAKAGGGGVCRLCRIRVA